MLLAVATWNQILILSFQTWIQKIVVRAKINFVRKMTQQHYIMMIITVTLISQHAAGNDKGEGRRQNTRI
jgi:hypothetical protein